MSRNVSVQKRTERPSAAIRVRGAVEQLPSIFAEGFTEIVTYLERAGVAPTGAPYATYFNRDMQDLDIELGFPVARPVAGEGRIQSSSIPGGDWLIAMHVGPYDQVGPVYDEIEREAAESGRELVGTAYEFYFDPAETPPEETRTEIGMPLK